MCLYIIKILLKYFVNKKKFSTHPIKPALRTHRFPCPWESADKMIPGQSINDSQTMVSEGGKFELGFFSRGDPSVRYLGIWYKSIPIQTVVWVANRDSPLVNSSGTLTFTVDGNVVLLNQTKDLLWSSSSSHAVRSPVARLLDTGNFILRDDSDNNKNNFLWQSFDYPFDTLLAGMKLGWSKKSDLNWHLTSWKSSNDPSSGDYTYSVDPGGLPQLVLRKGSTEQFRSGPWYGNQFSGMPALMTNPVFQPTFVSSGDNVYYSYNIMNNLTSRFVLSPSGLVQHFSWNDRLSSWNLLFTVQQDRCDTYGLCGDYGVCDINNPTICSCMKGFQPRSPRDWEVMDWSGGCIPVDPQICGNKEGFMKMAGLKLPDASEFRVNVSISTGDCKAECLKNCTCVAYAKLDIEDTGNSCVTWSRGLIDVRKVAEFGQDLYVRVAASELEADAAVHIKQKNVAIAVSISLSAALIILILIGSFVAWTNRRTRENQPNNEVNINRIESQREDLELPVYEFTTIQLATNNFSAANKIGEGGFGPVYKGELQYGQEVAVKRQRENSGQGLREFKNEVILISKLQHRNLVKLLGCCIHGEDRMLIYEYMPKGSLDSFIFDETMRPLLKWKKRVDIIVGIARGVLYLHRDSRLRIIHRDLKAGNVLLDSELNPKISDFGMAKLFGGDQVEGNTKRIVGTYGYMPPEYAIDGHFSLKSDVFSFGVILLETVSGKRNRGFFHLDHKLNLLGHAWKLWNEGKALELVDQLLECEFSDTEAMRCIQVGLLCVQQRPEDRPTMASVLLMLDAEDTFLPDPRRPGFCAERCLSETESSSLGKLISNELTVTLSEGR
ncbi:hypothetical protein K2173_001634 [Erythroxylum novogranatense]|uniref:Receptor-like serine/threonine-protein kinase n=1 Tax=Erythroxylum novogranatense TaxID=1862640 RepID=A0AAV8T420_9ROSI|nr:hypothetical protein K2173_001634 [Erythroxylum novogranatense]